MFLWQDNQARVRREDPPPRPILIECWNPKSHPRLYKKKLFSVWWEVQRTRLKTLRPVDSIQKMWDKTEESTPLRTHCLIYFINVKMSRVKRLLCDLRMSDVTNPHVMECIMYHVITFFAKYTWIRDSQRVVDLALNHCRTLSTLWKQTCVWLAQLSCTA